MANRRETTITNELVNILRNMRHGWELETEVNAFIKGNSELDAIVIERGREPVGIEAKFATTTNAKNLIEQAETRLVLELETEYHVVGKTLNNVMAILYPDRFKTIPGADINSTLRTADDLQYKLVNTVGDTVGHFPENGWATGIAQIHELAGIVFQKLITDRKYVKANYTLPESAVLLSTLVMPELPKGKLPKVADFACGTGALLNGVYQRILALYEQQGGNGRDIHQKMLEENIAGADVMPNATHLTAAALASRYAER